MPTPLPVAFRSRLNEIFPPSRLYTDPADCWSYGYDNSRLHNLPAAVVFPVSEEETRDLVLACNEFSINVTARGCGTGTTGASVPSAGAIVLSFERFNKVIDFSPENRYLEVEPGITNKAVQNLAAKASFFWPPDPTSAAFCSIGGNLAYNSAGPRALKYGTPRENTLGLRAVTGAGKSIRTGVHTTKGVVGYDLTRLLIGSEGTLAIITRAVLKLTPIPESKSTIRAVYSDISAAAEAIAQIMTKPTIPCALELLDHNALTIIQQYSKLDLPKGAQAMLMIEVDGPSNEIATAVRSVSATAGTKGILEVRSAKTLTEVQSLWHARKALSPALRQVAPGKINEDIVVPVTQIPSLIAGLDSLATEFDLRIVNFGHAGNGNIHVNILYDPNNKQENSRANLCLAQIFKLVLQLKGSLSGEHGIGLAKRQYITQEIDHNSLTLMKNIKQQFDPNGILNPGKIFPQETESMP